MSPRCSPLPTGTLPVAGGVGPECSSARTVGRGDKTYPRGRVLRFAGVWGRWSPPASPTINQDESTASSSVRSRLVVGCPRAWSECVPRAAIIRSRLPCCCHCCRQPNVVAASSYPRGLAFIVPRARRAQQPRPDLLYAADPPCGKRADSWGQGGVPHWKNGLGPQVAVCSACLGRKLRVIGLPPQPQNSGPSVPRPGAVDPLPEAPLCRNPAPSSLRSELWKRALTGERRRPGPPTNPPRRG
ncbi:hypothetical protein SAMN06265355_10939 [Actinomadura mexicana]|uniref:Uncharacterized protein n=1 Tax=Actinomadura mexicana TaxID=134959 RepID=A0A239AK55_9ACTN|nr:hypothetical protein SAMN06265355_10939 [Actinomadura mexicana]